MPHGFLLHHLISLTPSSLSERLARLVSTFRLVCFRLAEGCVLRDLLDRRLRRLAVYDDFQTIILVPARAPWRKPAVQLVVFLLGGAQRHRPLRPKNPICFGSLHHFRDSNLQLKVLIKKFICCPKNDPGVPSAEGVDQLTCLRILHQAATTEGGQTLNATQLWRLGQVLCLKHTIFVDLQAQAPAANQLADGDDERPIPAPKSTSTSFFVIAKKSLKSEANSSCMAL